MTPGTSGTHITYGAHGTSEPNLACLFPVIKSSFILMNVETVNLNAGF
jgi:hypothetical protein